MENDLPIALEFLSSFYTAPRFEYKQCSWLLSDFNADKWKYIFDFATPKLLNWNIKIDGGSSLLDPANHNLLEGLKYFLATSTRSTRRTGIELGSVAAQHTMFNRAVHIIDYLLLNAEAFQLSRFGLAGVNGDHLKEMLELISRKNNSAESIYEWTKTVSKFCVDLVESSTPEILEQILDRHAGMRTVTEDQINEHNLHYNKYLIPYVRAALYANSFYERKRALNSRSPNNRKIAKTLYANTLRRGILKLPTLTSLVYSPDEELLRREYPGAPVRMGEHTVMTVGPFKAYRFLALNLGILHEIGLPAPEPSDLEKLLAFEPSISEPARFRTLPYPIVRDTLKCAIEYHFKYGDLLIDGFCRMAEYCVKNDTSPTRINDEKLQELLGSGLQRAGVRQLGLSALTVSTGNKIRVNRNDHFVRLRNNTGLIENIRIYIGCVQLVTGTITARRLGEMIELHASDCLDKTEQWLIFRAEKSTSNLFGLRRRQARPIEPVAVNMIKNLIRMQRRLLKCAYIPEMTDLFASPDARGNPHLLCAANSYNRNYDLLCDYFELPINPKGQRYYIRQHQLRRIFSMLFFHSSSFGGLETLQWMLGHTDMHHVWNYITESVDGSVLKSAKSQFVAESLHNGDITPYEDLAALLKQRYGTDNFSLVDTDELEDAITDLMNHGDIRIDPEFFTDESGQHMRIVVKVQGGAL